MKGMGSTYLGKEVLLMGSMAGGESDREATSVRPTDLVSDHANPCTPRVPCALTLPSRGVSVLFWMLRQNEGKRE